MQESINIKKQIGYIKNTLIDPKKRVQIYKKIGTLHHILQDLIWLAWRLNFSIHFLLVNVLWLKMILNFPLIWIITLAITYLTVNFCIDDNAKILQNLDPNKLHVHDKISICMLQLCDNSICKPLELIFKQSMESRSHLINQNLNLVTPV